MPKFEFTGMDELVLELSKMAGNVENVAEQMLYAGAEELKKAWQRAIVNLDLVDTWAMHDSIGFKPKIESYGGAAAITVTPQGKDASGTSNAEKAWVLNYGVPSRNIKPHHHFDEAQAIADYTVVNAMEKVFDEFVRTGNVPAVELSKNNSGGKPTKAHKKDRRGRRDSKRRRET